MKIVVLDGYTLNPGDLSWGALEALGDVKVHDRTPREQIVERAAGAEVVLTNKVPLDKDTLSRLPDLRYIGVMATGYNIIDTEAAAGQGIVVANVPAYSTPSVVQMTFSLLLELCLHVQRHSDAVMSGKWAASPDFCFWDFPLVELSGKTMGIIGFGDIGSGVGDVAAALGMQVVATARRQRDVGDRKNFRWASVEELLTVADVVSIHCPLTPETRGLINTANLKKMKSSAFLINTSRGPIVVDQDLADALNGNVIAGAGLDVLSEEPPKPDNPLFKARNCIITPHISWATLESRRRLLQTIVSNLQAFKAGKPVNLVNG